MADDIPVENVSNIVLNKFRVSHAIFSIDDNRGVSITYDVGYADQLGNFVPVATRHTSLSVGDGILAFAQQAVNPAGNLWQNIRAALRAEVIKELRK